MTVAGEGNSHESFPTFEPKPVAFIAVHKCDELHAWVVIRYNDDITRIHWAHKFDRYVNEQGTWLWVCDRFNGLRPWGWWTD